MSEADDSLAFRPNRNAVYISGPSIPGLMFSITFNYEGMLSSNPDKFISSLWLRVGGGAFSSWGDGGTIFLSTLNLLTGKRNSHFELGLGLCGISNPGMLLPAVSLGYRYFNPGKALFFRAGGGFPEIVYLGIGLSF
jgi:hypothetical protein